LSGASEDAERAWFARYPDALRERGSAGERSFATLGQNKRPRESTDKTHAEILKERKICLTR